MAVSIDWYTKVITVPRADMTLVQSNPTEIRELNLNWFRLQLKALEDTEFGIPYTDTHIHNTEVTLGGLTYARVIEIIDPYTITFEDGQYAVNLAGANSNVGDKVNVNQVSVRSANSAGMTSSPAIEYSSFNGGVTLDETADYSGTVYPIGTPQMPVNNLADAMLIAEYRGFTTIYVLGDAVIDSGADYRQMIFIGASKTKSTLTISEPAQVDDCEFYDAHVTGTLDGDATLHGCLIDDLDYVTGYIEQCVLDAGTIQLGLGATAHFLDCWSGVPGEATPIVDMGGEGQALAMRNYNGGILIQNKTGTESVSLDLNSGQVRLDLATVVNGTIVVRGIGKVVDADTGEDLPTGYYGDLYLLNEAMNRNNISAAVWDEQIADHLISGTAGRSIGIQQYDGAVTIDVLNGSPGTVFPIGTHRVPVNNVPDAIAIASDVGVDSFHVIGNMTAAGGPFTGYRVYGDNVSDTTITADNLNCQGVIFENLTLTGTFSNNSYITTWNCVVEDVTDIELIAHRTSFGGAVRLINGPDNKTVFYDCYDDVPGIGIPDIQVNECTSLGIWNYNGGIQLSNIITPDTEISLMIAQGRLWVDETCVEGDIILKGLADLRGETGGTTIDQTGLIDNTTVANSVWTYERA